LIARVPSYAEFEAGIGRVEYLSTNTKQKGLVQYLLQRLDQHQRHGPPVDYTKMTIEHIAPESPPSGSATVDGVGRLGNLLLLGEGLNNKLGNKAFADKQKLYKGAVVPVDTVLTGATDWTVVEIDKRTKELAKVAYEKVFRV